MEIAGKLWDAAICLCNCGINHAAYIFKLEKNLESLKKKAEDLKSTRIDVLKRIEDAEGTDEMQRTSEVNRWLEKVEHLQKEREDIEDQASREIDNKCIGSFCPKNSVSSYKLGRKVVDLLKEVDELLNSGKHFVDKNIDIAYKLPPRLVEEMPSVETVGLDVMFNKVWSAIEDENLDVIGLYGMGGAGKTTLMNKIHSEFGKRRHNFDLVLWVVVSKECDINKIMNDIRKRLGINDDVWNNISQVHERVTKIYRVLKQKKFVLMLDDIWGKLELENVGVPLPKDTKNQSKVLFTTRSEDVCARMQAQKKFKVECLSEKEAFDLFCKKVGEETLNCHSEIPELAKDMVKECGGLPLALITVGSAMAGVDSVESWRQAIGDLTSSSWIGPDLEKKVFCVLKFSYERLPDETHKNCFRYCALYPEDYEVSVDDLIDRWIAEGFLGKGKAKKGIYDMYEEGKDIIARLKLSCLLEGIEDYDTWWFAIKMHDMIRDMAIWLARDEDGNEDKVVVQGEVLAMSEVDPERLNVVERISIIDGSGSGSGSWKVPACPNLLTMCVRGNVEVTDYSNLESMTRLKVLDIEHQHLPIEIGKLINLEFLYLSDIRTRDMWTIDLKNLKKLRFLLVQYARPGIILEGIESLEQLKVCRLLFTLGRGSAGNEEAILEKLECLPKLEELCIRLTSITGIRKLLESIKLGNCLRHFLINGSREPLEIEMTSILASLSRMKHLDHIVLRHVENITEGSYIANTCRLCNLRRVEISMCGSITHLTWLRYAPLLEFLWVDDCDSIEEVVKEAKDDRDTANDVFQSLRHLSLTCLSKLNSIHKRALAFPFLKLIYIEDCPNLRKLPLNSNSAKDSLIAIEARTSWWRNLEWEDVAVKDLFQSKLRSMIKEDEMAI
ncbi:probable disease resistance protein At5g63020 [Gastrolobium bilobum]|uniref:probable disease resistance protein At5g63020 n=1 Tax=Gastrolobium bilobum TaxID=150636 RepID=UPI002AB0F58D|nr:probable disease resistance protein At5g63020 [Gastrolobium bilobum]